MHGNAKNKPIARHTSLQAKRINSKTIIFKTRGGGHISNQVPKGVMAVLLATNHSLIANDQKQKAWARGKAHPPPVQEPSGRRVPN